MNTPSQSPMPSSGDILTRFLAEQEADHRAEAVEDGEVYYQQYGGDAVERITGRHPRPRPYRTWAQDKARHAPKPKQPALNFMAQEERIR